MPIKTIADMNAAKAKLFPHVPRRPSNDGNSKYEESAAFKEYERATGDPQRARDVLFKKLKKLGWSPEAIRAQLDG